MKIPEKCVHEVIGVFRIDKPITMFEPTSDAGPIAWGDKVPINRLSPLSQPQLDHQHRH